MHHFATPIHERNEKKETFFGERFTAYMGYGLGSIIPDDEALEDKILKWAIFRETGLSQSAKSQNIPEMNYWNSFNVSSVTSMARKIGRKL